MPTSIPPDAAIRDAFERGILPAAPLLLAISGGADSMALLTAFLETAGSFHSAFAVGHVDHGWRGKESRSHADFVERFCARRNIPFHRSEGKPDAKGKSREAAARDFRYDRLQAMAREIGAAGVVTAHTQDDAAETLLLALLRGRPLEGLAGIRERRADGVFRPMLGVSRRSVLAYLRSRGVPHRRDSSNADLSFDRNWLRKKVVPLLSRRFGRGVSANLAASAESLARDWEWLTEVFQSGAGASLETVAGAAAIPRATIARMPPAAVRRALLAMARAVGGERFAPTRRELLALQRLVEGGSDFRFQAGRRVEFLARRDRLRAFAVTKKAR